MHRIVAFTGAGISKASGVPTFQELGDIRDKLSREYFNNAPSQFYKLLLSIKEIIDGAVPNQAHYALAEYNIPVITMNIDGLHKKAGSKNIIEIHGDLEHVVCPKCCIFLDFYYLKKSILCPDCKEIVQPNVVLYGDNIPRYFDAAELIGTGEELLVVGTSFYTSTAADLVQRAEWAGIKVKVINEYGEEKVPLYLKKILGDK